MKKLLVVLSLVLFWAGARSQTVDSNYAYIDSTYIDYICHNKIVLDTVTSNLEHWQIYVKNDSPKVKYDFEYAELEFDVVIHNSVGELTVHPEKPNSIRISYEDFAYMCAHPMLSRGCIEKHLTYARKLYFTKQ